MTPFLSPSRSRRRGLRAVLPTVLLFTAACASAPPPTASLQAAQQSIANAERVEAGTHSAAELNAAKMKMAAAQSAIAAKDMTEAGRRADEARADAELAVAKTGAAKAQVVNADMERSTATLIEEMRRKTGDGR